ncbi:MAG: ribonucleotide-diphosphate reductase subunit beta [Bdellovibrionales bacterium]|nr:ribonucleotide-diphosphate reductase subunit beta [Bdellovibrionales bacterium]
MLLEPGLNLTLRPLKYPPFYKRFKDAIKNTWTLDDIDLSTDLIDLDSKITIHERRGLEIVLVFFTHGKQMVAGHLVEDLYRHLNCPEAKLYLSRQLFEESLHIQFYLTLLDAYLPQPERQAKILALVGKIPSISIKTQFCLKWSNSIKDLKNLNTHEDRKKFLLNLIGFSTCVEGIFFSGAFAYICFLHSKDLLPGLAIGTQRILHDERQHFNFSLDLIETIRKKDPSLFSQSLNELVVQMIEDAIECEMEFAEEIFEEEISGLALQNVRQYLEFVADQKLDALGMPVRYHVKNPFYFMDWPKHQEYPTFSIGRDFSDKVPRNELYFSDETL